jgi:two-component system, LytTR family, response regulator
VTLRVLLVDDEPRARLRLAHLITRSGAAAVVVGEAGDGVSASAAINHLRPDVILLDLRMPGVDGMTLARQLAQLPDAPLVIFTTAHDRALDAFATAAVDYLLKPIEQARLAAALERAAARLAERAARLALHATAAVTAPGAAQLADLLVPPLRLSARSGAEIRLYDPRHITRLWSEDKYTLFRHGGLERILDESLNVLESVLAPLGFLRIHRGELVQLAAIRAVHLGGDVAEVELDDGQRAAVSRRALPTLRRRLAER